MSDPSTWRAPQEPVDRAARRRPPADGPAGSRSDRPEHPTGQAVVLLVVVTLVIVGLAALSATGRL